MTLTDEEIRIAIHEARGLCAHKQLESWSIEDGNDYDYGFTCKSCGKDPHDASNKVPNYPQDLNACAEFEATLTEDELEAYREHISELLNDTARIGLGFTAKPKIRCIAYLKTKGLIP